MAAKSNLPHITLTYDPTTTSSGRVPTTTGGTPGPCCATSESRNLCVVPELSQLFRREKANEQWIIPDSPVADARADKYQTMVKEKDRTDISIHGKEREHQRQEAVK